MSPSAFVKKNFRVNLNFRREMEQRIHIVGFALLACIVTGQVLGQDETSTFQTVISNGYNFSVSDQQLPWASAVNACIAIGQTLATVESSEKDNILVELFVEEKDNDNVTLKGNSWIAATEVREGVWNWDTTGKPLYHTRWFVGQPDDTANLNCVYVATTALLYWRDANCSASMYFICEAKQDEDDKDKDSASPELRQSVLLITLCAILAFNKF